VGPRASVDRVAQRKLSPVVGIKPLLFILWPVTLLSGLSWLITLILIIPNSYSEHTNHDKHSFPESETILA